MQTRSGVLPRGLRFESLEDRRVLSVAMPEIELLYNSPALFVENQGQWADAAVRYFHQGKGANVAIMDSGVAFQVLRHESLDDTPAAEAASALSRFRKERLGVPNTSTEMRQFSAEFVGATTVRPLGLQPSETRFNYFVGDPTYWRSEVPGYEKVAYEGLYPGIDLHTWGLRSSLKYEFHVAPGADWSQIQIRYDGIDGLSLTDDGALAITLGDGWGQWVDDKPFIYQVLDGQQVQVAGHFELVDEVTYTFVMTEPYDATAPLIIDPDLAWSTYLGGSGTDRAYDVTTDASGNILVTGETASSGWVSGGWDTSGNNIDAFVVKLSPTGTHLWSTYVGGTADELGYGIVADSSGNVIVTGETMWDGSDNNPDSDTFVIKLNPELQYLYSTDIDYGRVDFGVGIAVDSADNILISGFTAESESDMDGFVTKLTPTLGTSWTRNVGTYLAGVAVDAADNVFVSGETDSAGLVRKLSSAGGTLWTISLGSSGDYATGVAVDADGNALVTGYTESSGWTSGGYDTTYGGNGDGFVAKLNTTNGARMWSSYLGGGEEDIGWAVAVDAGGDVLVSGQTKSAGWVSDGLDTTHNGNTDAFLVRLSSAGAHIWSSYLGGSQNDIGWSVDLDEAGSVVVVGETNSSGWLTGTPKGGVDAFVVKFAAPNQLPEIEGLSGTPNPVTRPTDVTLSAAGVSDPDGEVLRVEFYRDTNSSGGWDVEDEPLGADEDGADGWSWTGSTAGWTLGQQLVFARAQDDDTAWSQPVRVLVDIENANPVVTSLAATPNPVPRPAELTLTAEEVSDADGQVVEVAFYRDADGSGDWNAGDQLLGTDEDGGDGWSWTGSTAGWTLGSQTVFARAQDNDGAWSDPVAASVVVENALPVVVSFSGNRNPIPQSADLTLTAVVSDSDGLVDWVEFYRDTNGSGEWDDGDESLGAIAAGADEWTWTGNTAEWALGPHVFFARAQDNDGQWSAPVTSSVTVAYWQNLNNPFDVDANGSVDSGDVLLLVNEINRNGSPALPPRSVDNLHLPFFDVNGDGYLTPLDVLMVIHFINVASMPPAAPGASGEGEWATEGYHGGPTLPTLTVQITDRPGRLWNSNPSGADRLPALAASKRSLVQPHRLPDDERALLDWETILEDRSLDGMALDAYFATLGNV